MSSEIGIVSMTLTDNANLFSDCHACAYIWRVLWLSILPTKLEMVGPSCTGPILVEL